MKRLFISMLCLAAVTDVFGWGQKGHDTVAYIAENHLSPEVAAKVTALLDGHSLVYYANWMDNASHTPDYAFTSTWHYVNVDEEEQTYAQSEKHPKGDVVVAINEIVSRLKNGGLSPERDKVDLMMLIHLVGDMHCPMHAGHKCDRGGNNIQVKYFHSNTKLHSVWDSKLVESAHNWSYSEWQYQIDRATAEEAASIAAGCPNDWIEETVVLSRRIYEDTPAGASISYDYINKYTPVLEQQLLKGGIRLAALLEYIYGDEC